MTTASSKGKKGNGAPAMTIAKLRRMGAFNGGGGVEDRLRLDNKVLEFSVDYLLPLARTGNKVLVKSEEGNAKLKREADAQHADWQAKAAKLWTQPQHAKKGKAAIARLIDSQRYNTVRHFISKPEK